MSITCTCFTDDTLILLINPSASVPFSLCFTGSNILRFRFVDFSQISWWRASRSAAKCRPQILQEGRLDDDEDTVFLIVVDTPLTVGLEVSCTRFVVV